MDDQVIFRDGIFCFYSLKEKIHVNRLDELATVFVVCNRVGLYWPIQFDETRLKVTFDIPSTQRSTEIERCSLGILPQLISVLVTYTGDRTLIVMFGSLDFELDGRVESCCLVSHHVVNR